MINLANFLGNHTFGNDFLSAIPTEYYKEVKMGEKLLICDVHIYRR